MWSCRFAWQAWHFVTLHTLHFTLHSLHSPLHTLQSTLYFHTLHSTLYIPTLHSTLYTPHFTLHTSHPTHSTHFTLYTSHSILHIREKGWMRLHKGSRGSSWLSLICFSCNKNMCWYGERIGSLCNLVPHGYWGLMIASLGTHKWAGDISMLRDILPKHDFFSTKTPICPGMGHEHIRFFAFWKPRGKSVSTFNSWAHKMV